MKKVYLFLLLLLLNFALNAQVNTPDFSHERGYYDNSFQLTISSTTSNSTIYYTTDGTKPSSSNGSTLSGSITIDESIVIRAIAYASGQDPSPITSHTYLFMDDILNQPHDISGWPNTTYATDYQGNTAEMDYEMDPAIVNDPQYADDIVQGFADIPTVCLALEQSDFWDTHDNGKSENESSVEIIYPDDPNDSEQADCIIVGMSHSHQKRSIRMEFKADIGPSKFDSQIMKYAVFHGETAAGSYDQLVLRAGTQRSWARNWVPDGTAHTRDQWYRDTQLALSGASARGTFVHVFVNAVYFGMYNIAERPNTKFMEDYFGGNDDEWYAYNHNGTISGNSSRYDYVMGTLTGKDMSNQSNYEELKEYVNVEQFIDYILSTWITGMVDWPGNNYYGGNRNAPNAEPMLFFAWDGEQCWDSEFGANTGAWVHKRFEKDNDGGDDPADKIFNSAKKNDDFMMLLADRVYEHCFNDGLLTDAAQRARWAALNNFIYNAVVCESARWGDGLEDGVTRTRNNQWQTEVDRVDGVMNGNVSALMSDMYDNNYYPNIDPPTFNEHGGEFNSSFSLAMSNPNGSGTIYYRLDGGDPRDSEGETSSQAQTYNGNINLVNTVTVKARVKNGNEWSAVHSATFVINSPITGLYINEFLASNDSDISTDGGDFEDWIEIYNSNNTPINLAGLYMTDDLGNPTKFQIPATDADATTVPANGFIYLWADDVTQLGADHLGFKLGAGGEDIGLVQMINNSPSVIDEISYGLQSADISYGRYPDGSDDWEFFNETTPGASNISDNGEDDPITGLFINEVMARNTAGITDEGGQFEDWVEIYNSNSEAVDVGGLYVTDDKAVPNLWQIPTTDAGQTTIPPGGFLRLWADGETVDGVLHLDIQLNGQGEFVGLAELVGGSLEYIDSLSFGAQVPNISYQRFPDGSNNLEFTETSTPEASNVSDVPSTPSPISGVYINEILASNSSDITDELGEFEDWLELYNSNGSPVDIGGLFLTDDYDKPTLWEIPSGTTIPAGGFIYFWVDQDISQGSLHTNFQLSNSGEEVALVQFTPAEFVFVDSITFGNQQSNISYGRYPDGDVNKEKMMTTTPGASNVQSPVVNQAPQIDPISDQNHLEGATVSLAVSATDPEGDDITYSQSGLPAGLSLNSSSGEISGTITAAINTYTVTITATDNGSPQENSQISFDWTVSELLGSNEFWLELECADFNPGNWTEVSDGGYSEGAYLSTSSGENLGEPSNFNEALRYDIETSESGIYYIYWRAEGASGHNSIWYYNGSNWEQGPDFDSAFGWQEVGQISLSQGTHSLYFAKREGVSIADKMYVGLINNAPTGAGEDATNCAPPAAILNGNVSVSGCDGESLGVKLYEVGTSNEVLSTTATIDVNGDFALGDITPGAYDIYVKLDNCLQKLQTETLVSGSNSISFGALQAGDVNNDNLVNFADFGLLAGSFNKADGAAGFVEGADFNCDGLVNFADFGLLAGNFNQSGDQP